MVDAKGDGQGCFPSSPAGGGGPRLISFDLETELANQQELLQGSEYVRVGDQIKLKATSRLLLPENQAQSTGGYLGMYQKTDGITQRLAVPPLGPKADGTFVEQVLEIVDPYEDRKGQVLRYGDTVILVDSKTGMVWNNKCGTGTLGFFEGYLGPKPRGSPGELFMSFQKNGHDGKPLVYGDVAVFIDIVDSHRTRNSYYNNRLTNYKTGNSKILGGYVTCSGSGKELPILVHRYTGPPLQAYSNPLEERLKQRARKTSRSFSAGTFAPPDILSVAVQRNSGTCEEAGAEGDMDTMIKNPLYGKPIKLYHVKPDDDIVINLDQENSPVRIKADQLFSAAERAAEHASKNSDFVPASVPPLQLEATVPMNAEKKSHKRHRNSNGSVKVQLSSVELLVEQDLYVLKGAFHDDQALSQALYDGDDDDDLKPSAGKLNLLIASYKLSLFFFTFAVVVPYILWEFVLIIGDLIEPIHMASSRNKSLQLIERLATTLVRDFGIPVVNGTAQITDAHRELETTTLTTTMVSLLLCFAAGLITPPFVTTGLHSGGSKSGAGRGRSKSKDQDEFANWLVSIQVPEGSWEHQASFDSFTSNRTLLNGSDTDEDEADEEDAKFKVNGVRLRGLWGEAGVGPDGLPLHPAWSRFLAGCKGDVEEAKRRWVETCEWRAEANVDDILDLPHPNFDIIKQAVPNFYFGRAKLGHLVYIDCPGQVDLKLLKQAGCDIADLLFHYTYATEFVWRMLETSEDAKSVSILDVDGVGFSSFSGKVKDYVQKVIKLSGTHYPERLHKNFIVNAPFAFRGIWAVVKNFIDANTLEKVSICGSSGYQDDLFKLVDPDQVPQRYGGTCGGRLTESKEERLFESFVCKKLVERGMEMNRSPRPQEHQLRPLKERVDETLLENELGKSFYDDYTSVIDAMKTGDAAK